MKKGVFLLGATLLSSSTWALNLSQAYEAALAQDSLLKAAQATNQARQERLPQARAQLLPNLSLSASRNRNELKPPKPISWVNPLRRFPITTEPIPRSRCASRCIENTSLPITPKHNFRWTMPMRC